MIQNFLFSFLVGIDWGFESHQICVKNQEGEIIGENMFPHGGDGINKMINWLMNLTGCDPALIAANIETPNGPIVDALMEQGIQTFSINPKQLDRFRDRFSPAGAKDDRLDASVLADVLRTDPQCLRQLNDTDPILIQLRSASRMKDDLTRQRTALSNKIKQVLWRYFPQYLILAFDLYSPVFRELWTHISTPDRAQRVQCSSVQKILKKYRIRRLNVQQVLEQLRDTPLILAAGVAESATRQIRLYLQHIQLIDEQIKETTTTIESLLQELFAKPEEINQPEGNTPTEESDASKQCAEMAMNLPAEEADPPKQLAKTENDLLAEKPKEYTDMEILLSVPGIGYTVLATLISEAYILIQSADYRALRCFCGVAPVTKQSGKSRRVVQRKACHWRLVNALYHMSRVAAIHDPICKAKYQGLRARGHSHGRALRSVADRLLGVICAMIRDRTLYDPNQPTAAAKSSE